MAGKLKLEKNNPQLNNLTIVLRFLYNQKYMKQIETHLIQNKDKRS